MSEQLDNELRRRINEVFEHYEDTAPAQEGWQLLRKKFPQKTQRRIAPLWWSAAATLLLLCLFGLWFNNKPTKEEQHAAIKNNKPLKPAYTDTITKHAPIQRATKTIANGQQYTGLKKEQQKGKAIAPSAVNNKKVPANIPPTGYVDANVEQQLIAATKQNSATPVNNLPVITNNVLVTAKNSTTDSNVNTNSNRAILAQQKATKGITKDSIAANAVKSPMADYLAKEQQKETSKKLKTEKKVTDKRVLYSVYAATYFNYAEGSKSQMNTGAGFGTDIKLFSNFKLSTGIALAKNTLNYSGQPTQAGILNEAIGVSRANDRSSASPNSNVATPALGFSSLTIATDPLVAGYDVSLTGLDVPLNIKYEFNPAKTDSYISAGLSSGTFINETYNYRYNNRINVSGFSADIPDVTTRKSFTRFDFARTLNLSLGMGYQITKNNRLVIEPFLKYPLSGLGSQQIRFGAGGINLRLKFQGTKK
jgi:hypothetical protein